MTKLPHKLLSFISFCGVVHAYWHSQYGSSLLSQYSCRPLLDDVDMFTSTLMMMIIIILSHYFTNLPLVSGRYTQRAEPVRGFYL